MIHLGIDPGKGGGISAIWDDGVYAGSASLKAMTNHDVAEWLRQFDLLGCSCLIEKVHSSPQMGVKSAFSFGQSLGFLEGLLTGLQVPYEYIRPQEWQKAMKCLSGGDKNVTKAAAQRLFPMAKVTHAIADSMLIAEHGRRRHMDG